VLKLVKVRNSKLVFPDESVGFIFLLFSLPYSLSYL